jgi:hypothetical protein
MVDWMDKIEDDLEKKAAADDKARLIQESVRGFFTGLESFVKKQIPTANQRFFQGRDLLEFSHNESESPLEHFIVRTNDYPAMVAKLKVDLDTGIFTITVFEKPDPGDNDYHEVERLEVNLTTDPNGHPQLARSGTLLKLPDAAGLMLDPLVRRSLRLK